MKPTVLIVEDEPLIRLLTVGCLEDLGCATSEAGSSDVAIQLLQENSEFAVLFTDIQIPGKMDGLELAHWARLKWPSMIIVICSGRLLPMKPDLPTGVRFLAKPYYQSDLIDIAAQAGA